LSNFSPHPFVFDGVRCNSMEGLLQAFKFKDPLTQEYVCSLVGFMAKKQGFKGNKRWQRVQKLWWNGVEYDRHGDRYQVLLTRAYDALYTNQKFKNALLASRDAVLTHQIGTSKRKDTVLTKREFCGRLTELRSRLQNKMRN